MAKRSKLDTEKTIALIENAALEQILAIGYESMSYSTLSEATGISRTGISHHFPRKVDFLLALNQRIGQLFVESLDFSGLRALQLSWQAAMDSDKLRAILRLFFTFCARPGEDVREFAAIDMAKTAAMKALGEQGCALVSQLLGQSALSLLTDNRLAA
ncbi:TetR family transcriptional regulator [Shewanella avicenniae]|uniref:TetR family transcriptional regulator n=1 Tax=Shewanella avicenniae TaxID=2814294 RepID=A0ABX7QSD9_9GAMM|nr:TetR family transcriptional regulator [Shewanella avicenniae]QSX34377.1 TetR family transcriptional regulator [Shewanella avicenniae]